MQQPKWVSRYLISAAVLIGGSEHSIAQQGREDSEQDGRIIEEVVVTGSRIKRQDFLSISPIATVDAEAITLGGITSLEDLVNDLPQVVPTFDRTGNNPGNGAAELDLRGLGSQRTLIMLNGRRMAPHSVFGAVNINDIPAALIDRIEIVTGGASTVYGSDAVAGVVNFILDTEFDGATVSAQYDVFEEGDGDVYDVNLAGGTDLAGGRGHVTGFAGYLERKAVFAGDRGFTRVALGEDFRTGEIVEAGSVGVPGGAVFFPPTNLPGSGPTDVIIFDSGGSARPFRDPEDRFNFQPDNYLQVPLERKIGGLFTNYALPNETQLFAELTYSVTESGSQLAPSVFFSFVDMNVDHPALTPEQQQLIADNWDSDGDGIGQFLVGRRLSESGPRIIASEAENLRLVAGAEGRFAFGWDWEAYVSHSEIDRDTELDNGVLASRLQQGLLADPVTGECFDPSGGCVPLSLFGAGSLSDEAVAFLRVDNVVNRETVEEQVAAFNMTGEVLDLPAGPLSAAVGVEWRDLSGGFRSDDDLLAGGVLGFNSESGVEGSFDVAEFYVETLVPLLSGAKMARSLDLEAGVRYSDYSTSGGAENWKLGFNWMPIESLRFRAMTQRATRAPNLNELFREPVEFVRNSLGLDADECSASRNPAENGVADLCVAQGIPADHIGVFEAGPFPTTIFIDGGSLELEPEEADTLTVGAVFQPSGLPNLSMALDYYEIELDNAIATVPEDTAVALCFDANDINDPFCSAIVRGPSGQILEVTSPKRNLVLSQASGIDLIVDYHWDLPAATGLGGREASLELSFYGTHMIESGQQDAPGTPFVNCVGKFGGFCDRRGQANFIIAENRSNTRLAYHSGPLSVSLDWEWIDGLDNALDEFNERQGTNFLSNIEGVGSRNYFDLSAQYRLSEAISIYGGIGNVFEEEPPLLGSAATQSNTAPQLYDVFGRRFFLGLSWSWE